MPRQVGVLVFYQGMRMPLGFRADVLVADAVSKAVPALPSAHEAQVLTDPRMSGLPVELLTKFHATRLKDGLKRFVVSWNYFLSGPPAASALEIKAE